ncbi:hypothetical protein [Adhaeribacter aquaticus]|uniref:hypothetical protein n=1 Tax=Adhaeribacter aquaticus TaxID=299567 RepID=UPI0003F7725C|nr:hypothetical protein [Adhaeribacter aquaticus]
MGKRQVRVLRKDIIAKQAEFLGKSGHVILSDHVVFNGLIEEINPTQLKLRDPRFKKHFLEISAIEELVYDIETEF